MIFVHDLIRLLEDTLTFMAKTAQRTEQAAHDVTGKFLKALLNKAYEIVDKVIKSSYQIEIFISNMNYYY